MNEGFKHLGQQSKEEKKKNEFIGRQVYNIEENIQSSEKTINGKVQERKKW